MRPRLVALVGAASLTTGWLLASLLSPPVARLQGLPERERPRVTPREAFDDVPYTEQLHLKLQQAPLAPQPRRNPFVFGKARVVADAPRPPTVTKSTEEAPSLTDLPALAVAATPSLRLAGIGSNDTAAGAVRVAIISDGKTVHLAKVGESVGGYAVVEITDDTVTIADAAGARWALRFKP